MNWPTNEPGDSGKADADQPDPERRARMLEDIFILFCVLALWPVILGLQHVLYEVLLYAALVGLVLVFVRRARRFSRARREVD